MHESLLIIDFGSQFTQLIARRVRELNVYCEIHPYNHLPEIHDGIKGIILSGGPASVREENAPSIDTLALRGRFPVLGVCYGAQLMAQQGGGKVSPSNTREYGRAMLTVKERSDAFMDHVAEESQVWMSHSDSITEVPESFKIIASTTDVKVAAYHVQGENTYGLQFHPEVVHSV
jgi:GMP synthase (glutamine-hydrolysing)